MRSRRFALPLILALLALFGAAPRNARAEWIANGSPIGWDCGGETEYPNALPDGASGAFFFWRFGPEHVRRHDANGDLRPGWTLCGPVISNEPTGYQLQYEHVECPDGVGGFFIFFRMVVGCGAHCTGDPRQIYLQHVSADGSLASGWPAYGVPIAFSTNNDDHLDPTIAPDGQGGVVLAWINRAWSTFEMDLLAQRVSADGQMLWAAGGRVVCNASGVQRRPAILGTPSGGAMIFWEDSRATASVSDIYMRSVSAAGIPDANVNGVALCDADGAQTGPVAISDGAGGAYVVWSDARGGTGTSVYAQRVDAALEPQWEVGGLAIGDGGPAASCSDGAGGLLLAWSDPRNLATSAYDVYAQRLTPSGAPAPGWPSGGIPLCVAAGNQNSPAITTDGLGGFFAVWTDGRAGAGNLYGARWHGDGSLASGWSANGSPICTASGGQRAVALVPSLPGSAIVMWEDGRQSPREISYATRLVDDGPVAAEASLVRALATSSRVELIWQLADGCPMSASVERTEGDGWSTRANLTADGTCRIAWNDDEVAPGGRYGYRLAWSDASGPRRSAETWLDVPRALALAIRGMRLTESGTSLRIECAIPLGGEVRLAMLDVAGRQCAASREAATAAGVAAWSLDLPRAIPSGVYLVTIEQSGARATKLVAVIR